MKMIKILIISSIFIISTNLYATSNTYEIVDGNEKSQIIDFNIICSEKVKENSILKYLSSQYSKKISLYSTIENGNIKFETSKINNFDDNLLNVKIDILKGTEVFDSTDILSNYVNSFVSKKVFNGDYNLAFYIINSSHNDEYCKFVTNKPIKIIDKIANKINTKIGTAPKRKV